MNERYVRLYLKEHLQNIIVEAETRGSAVDPGVPEAVVWVGLDERASLRHLLPILVNSNSKENFDATIGIYQNFAESPNDNDRIVTPIYTNEPARRALTLNSSPQYEFQCVDTSHPEVYSAEWSGVQEYADEFAEKARDSARIDCSLGTPKGDYVPLRVRIRAPGAIFTSSIPFFAEEPSEQIFQKAIEEMTIPCITVSDSPNDSDQDAFPTDVLLPFIE